MTDSEPGPPAFTAVESTRSIDEVVKQVQEVILSGRYWPNDRLPSELELSEKLSVGRSTVREALRTLEVLGIIEIRRGRRGGIFVASPNGAGVASALEAMIHFREPTRQDLLEFRLSFEGETAWWAAKRADRTDHERLESIAKALRALVDHDDAWREIADRDIEFHVAMAEATKNQVRVAVMLAINRPLRRSVLEMGLYADANMRRAVGKELTGIAQAIGRGDGEQARRLVRVHVQNNPALRDATVPYTGTGFREQ